MHYTGVHMMTFMQLTVCRRVRFCVLFGLVASTRVVDCLEGLVSEIICMCRVGYYFRTLLSHYVLLMLLCIYRQ